MDLRNTTRNLVVVASTYALPTLLGWYLHNQSPHGLLLYTPPADGSPPQYSPAFPIGMAAGLALISIFSAALILAAITVAHFARTESTSCRAKSLARIGATALIASLLGVIAYAMHP